MKVHNNCFPSLSDKYLCGDLLGSQLSLGHKHSHLNQLQDRGLQPRNAPSPMLPCLCWMTFTTKAIFFPLIKLTKQVLQDVLISRSRCLPTPWHSRGSWVAAGLCSRCSGCSQRFGGCYGLALEVPVVWALHGVESPDSQRVSRWKKQALSRSPGRDPLYPGTLGTGSPTLVQLTG